MSILAITADGDLDFSTRNLVIVSAIDDAALIWLRKELRLFLGSWFLDLSKGFPWLQDILGRKPGSLTAIESLFRGKCLQCPNAVEAQVSVSFDGGTRALSVAFEVRLTDGSIVADFVTQV